MRNLKMVRSKKYLIIITLLATLLLAGCLNGGNGDAQQAGFGGSDVSSDDRKGVVLSFAERNPPERMFKGTPYTFAFVIENYQEHPINNLQIKTRGFDRGFITGLNRDYTVSSISAASETVKPAVHSGLVVNGVNADGFEGDYNFNPEFKYCYQATSTFREQICVPSENNVCETDVNENIRQNGPVQLSVERINSIDNIIRVDFKVGNKGSGNVVNECFEGDNYATQYTIDEVRLGSASGSCEPIGTNEFQLVNGEGSFKCEFQRGSEDSYSSQITAKISYSYEDSTKKNIVVENTER